MLITSSPWSASVERNHDLAYFAKKYGYHGVLYSLSDRMLALREVYQLDFSSCFHFIKRYEEKGNISEDQWKRHRIPDCQLVLYNQALRKNMLVFNTFLNGGQYNLPMTDWIEKDTPKYEELSKLKFVGYA